MEEEDWVLDILNQIKAGINKFNEDMKTEGSSARAGYPPTVSVELPDEEEDDDPDAWLEEHV